MANAFVTQYRQEYVAEFEQKGSLLRASTTTEAVVNGSSAVFQVAGSKGQKAVTRGANGQIPYKTFNESQFTVTLTEAHAPYEKTGFDIFASQGNQQAIMRQSSMNTIGRDIDDAIITQLLTSTVNTGAAATASNAVVQKAVGILGLGDVDLEDMDNLFGLITPAFRAYLMQSAEFSSGDYADVQPLNGPARKFFRWSGINWITSNSTGLNAGTNAEKCFIYHRSGIGHAIALSEEDVTVGFDEKQKSSWTNATAYHGAKLLQSTGVVIVNHDGSAIVGA